MILQCYKQEPNIPKSFELNHSVVKLSKKLNDETERICNQTLLSLLDKAATSTKSAKGLNQIVNGKCFDTKTNLCKDKKVNKKYKLMRQSTNCYCN